MNTIIWLAEQENMTSVRAIYANHVLHGTAWFEEIPPDATEIRHRRDAVLAAGRLIR